MSSLSLGKAQAPSIDALMGEALGHVRAGRSSAAIAALQGHDGLALQSAFACNLLGLLHGSEGRDGEALDYFDRALLIRPDAVEVLENRARALLRTGRTQAAIVAYKALAAAKPGDAGAHHGLGTALQVDGQAEPAIIAYDAALAINPAFPGADANRGIAFQHVGRLPEALAAYDRALALQPDDATTLYNRGNVLVTLGRMPDALTSYRRALDLEPKRVDILSACARALQALGQFEDALNCCARALHEVPAAFEPNVDCANILTAIGRPAEAIAFFDLAVRIRPLDPGAHCNRATALYQLGRYADALAACATAIACNPSLAQAWMNRGNALQALGRFEDALAAYESVLNLRPDDAEAFCYRGLALRELGRFPEAMASFDQSLALRPDFPHAVNHRSGLLLLLGDFAEGWKGYGGHALGGVSQHAAARQPWRQWPGPDHAAPEARLLVVDEHGLGDLIQYARYLPKLAASNARVTFACRPGMRRLLAPLTAGIQVADLPEADANFDYQIGVAGLPKVFRPDLASIPADTPYLAADAGLAAQWRDRLGTDGFKIGICWQGSAGPQSDGARAIPIAHFAALASIPGVRLISLQKADADIGAGIETFGEDFDTGPDAFADAAAVMKSLDLVVTCDTSIAHLAGALGVPVWVALKAVPDLRWMLDRSDSPWYPTMRLFRQTRRGQWQPVFEAIALALKERIGG